MLGELIPCGGGEPIALHDISLVVGRKPTSDICIPARIVSSTHCRLDYIDGAWHIRDLESRNGITINGHEVQHGELAPNDIVGFSRVRYQIVYSRAGSGAAAPERPSGTGARGFDPIDVLLSGPPKPPPADIQRMLEEEIGLAVGLNDDLGTLTPCGGGDPIVLFRPNLVVGRKETCDLILRFSTVSGKHCRLDLKDGFWFVEDLGSRNGIAIDGERVDEGWLLPGSILTIAKMRHEIYYRPPEGQDPPVNNPFRKGLLEKAGLKNIPKSDQDEERRDRYSL